MAISPSFIFDTSKGETPQTIAMKRALAAQIMGGFGNRPARNVGEGIGNAFASLGQGITANVMNRRASAGEAAGQAQAAEAFNPILDAVRSKMSNQFPATPGAGQGSVAPPSIPQTAEAAEIRQGLVQRGLPEHVADAFVLNMQDESGLNPGINERNPIVPGSRGGFGLYQLTGPRRRAYEQFAAQRGVDPSDTGAQLDFLMTELQGPESKAARSILSAPDTGTAAAAIVNDFLRPAEQHRNSRANRYMALAGQGGQPPAAQALDALAGGQPAQVASLDPSIGMGQMEQPSEPDLSQIPVTAGGNAGVVDPATMPAGQGPSMEQLAQALSSPWLMQNEGMKAFVMAQLQQQMQAQDPMRQLQMQAAQQGLEKGQLEIDSLRNPQPKTTDTMQNLMWRAQQAGLQPGSPEYNQFMISGGRNDGVTVNVGGDGDPYQKKFWETMAGADAKSFTDSIETGDQARRNRINLDRLSQLAGSTPQGFEGAMIRTLGEYGIKSEGLDKVQAMESLISQLVPTQRPPGSGTISDADLALYKASLPRLVNTPEGNRLILDTMYAINGHDIAASEIAARVASGELKPADARKELRQLPNPFDNWRDQVDAIEGGSASGGTPKAGEIIDGYRFRGGNPADPNSWERQ